jgi:hypothetical protein
VRHKGFYTEGFFIVKGREGGLERWGGDEGGRRGGRRGEGKGRGRGRGGGEEE